jgi:hypothetical protein
MSDRVCYQFLLRDGFCERSGCPFAHFRRIQIYHSLLPSVRVRYFCPRSLSYLTRYDSRSKLIPNP